MPASETFRISLAAGASNNNILAGSQFELVGAKPRRIRVFAICDPPTTAGATHKVSIFSGTNMQCTPNSPMGQASAAGIGPLRSDHLFAEWTAAPGDRCSIGVLNPDSAALVSRFLVEYTE